MSEAGDQVASGARAASQLNLSFATLLSAQPLNT